MNDLNRRVTIKLADGSTVERHLTSWGNVAARAGAPQIKLELRVTDNGDLALQVFDTDQEAFAAGEWLHARKFWRPIEADVNYLRSIAEWNVTWAPSVRDWDPELGDLMEEIGPRLDALAERIESDERPDS